MFFHCSLILHPHNQKNITSVLRGRLQGEMHWFTVTFWASVRRQSMILRWFIESVLVRPINIGSSCHSEAFETCLWMNVRTMSCNSSRVWWKIIPRWRLGPPAAYHLCDLQRHPWSMWQEVESDASPTRLLLCTDCLSYLEEHTKTCHILYEILMCFLSKLLKWNLPRKTMLASGSSIWYPNEVVVSCVLVLASNSTPTWICGTNTQNACFQYAPKVHAVSVKCDGTCFTCLLALW